MEVHNTGSRDGSELVQVYVKPLRPSVERPQHELKWFKKVFVPAGKSVRVEFELDKGAFSYYDVRLGNWRVDAGEYEIELCRDSRNVIKSSRMVLDSESN